MPSSSHPEGFETLNHTPLQSAFTPAQILHYLQHISFPLPLTHPRDATFLHTLHRCQITTIPYENLSLHYNHSHNNSINPKHLYAKFLPDFRVTPSPDPQPQPRTSKEEAVNSSSSSSSSTTNTNSNSSTLVNNISRGRGGFCFETSVFFLHVLRGLGFSAYPTLARIRIRDGHTRVPSGPFVGPRHVVDVVLLADGSAWVCDVGFGGDGPTCPLRLLPTPSRAHMHVQTSDMGLQVPVYQNLGAQEVRLRRGVFPDTLRGEGNGVWFYEYRNGEASGWNTYYAFGEAEASPWDLECANWWVATHPESFQRKQVLVVKFIRGASGKLGAEDREDGVLESGPHARGETVCGGVKGEGGAHDSEIDVVGKIMLADGVLKRNMGGRTEVVKVCRTEEERMEVLREYFGMHLTEEERLGIKGFETELIKP